MCEVRLSAGKMGLVCMKLNMCEVQPVPYEPCHGRPDSQPARPRLPPGCGSRTRSSPSEGGPPPLRTLDLMQNNDIIIINRRAMQHNALSRMLYTHVGFHR